MCDGECGCTGDCGPGRYVPWGITGGVPDEVREAYVFPDHPQVPPSPGSPPEVMDKYTEVWKAWKMASIFLFAIFVGAMIDSARSIRRIAG